MAPKIIERKAPTGKTEYGVQYADGHIKWCNSLLEANLKFYNATRKKKLRAKRNPLL